MSNDYRKRQKHGFIVSHVDVQTKQMIERLQTLVSSDGRFKNMREALHRLATYLSCL